MQEQIKAIENLMTEEDKTFLKNIYEPTQVAVPYSDAINHLTVTRDGAIRCYGKFLSSDNALPGKGETVYQESTDGGLSWKLHKAKQTDCPRASYKCPWDDYYFSYSAQKDLMAKTQDFYAYVSKNGSEDENFKKYIIPADGVRFYRSVLPLKSKKRWLIAGEVDGWDTNHTVISYSDDDCKTWKHVHLKQTPKFEKAYPHKGERWGQYGIEPTLTELSDGTVMVLLRTCQDYFYQCFSYDGGETFTNPEPSIFHGVNTMPAFLKLSNGKILLFFNNTRPMPEISKDEVWPPLYEWEELGRAEDVFTNRDANCIGITEDDGKSWFGFRELCLNPLRNTCDFRTSGSGKSGSDKSVHQFEAIELPFNKVLVHVGQHERLRKLMIFDVNWLYEKKRKENFTSGFDNVSTHVYLKSVTGNCRGNFPGHCAWNRTNGCVPVADPKGDYSEAILFKNTKDDRLLNNVQGMVWNFPALNSGKITINAHIMGKGFRVNLCDHWINPSDASVSLYSVFEDVLENDGINDISFRTYEFCYDINKKECTVIKNGEK